MKYHFKIQKEKKGFFAQCMELQGCLTQGDTMEELYANMREALNLYVHEPEDSKDLAEFPNENIRKSKNIIEVPLDPEIAASFMLRHRRVKLGNKK